MRPRLIDCRPHSPSPSANDGPLLDPASQILMNYSSELHLSVYQVSHRTAADSQSHRKTSFPYLPSLSLALMSRKRSFVLDGDPLITGIIRDKITMNKADGRLLDCCFFITVTQEFEQEIGTIIAVAVNFHRFDLDAE